MFNWLRRKRSKSDPRKTAPKIPKKSAPSAQASVIQQTPGPSLSDLDVDTRLYNFLLSTDSPVDRDLDEWESRVSRDLDKTVLSDLSQSDSVPRVPAVIPRLMQMLRNDEVSGADIAQQVGRDATLVAEVLRLANSPYYRAGHEINSLEQAIFVLGRNGLRQLIVGAAMKPLLNIQTGHFSRHGGPIVWAQAEKCAVACLCLAKSQGLDQFEAYLAGLVQNIGLIVVIKQLDAAFAPSNADLSSRFRDICIAKSKTLSVKVVADWEFPGRVLTAIKEQSQVDQPDQMSPLGRVLFSADKLSKMRVLVDEGRIDDETEQLQWGGQEEFRDHCLRCYAEL